MKRWNCVARFLATRLFIFGKICSLNIVVNGIFKQFHMYCIVDVLMADVFTVEDYVIMLIIVAMAVMKIFMEFVELEVQQSRVQSISVRKPVAVFDLQICVTKVRG